MSSTQNESLSAEQRFRQAFERLQNDAPILVKRGTPVSQNNVAKEAGCDPSALRKTRFPALIREIQGYVELRDETDGFKRLATPKKKLGRRSEQERLADALKQRDAAQSMMISANRRIVELTEKVEELREILDKIQPPPLNFPKK